MHPDSQHVYLVAALVCAIVASATDLRSRRIPNALTAPAMLGGLLLHLSLGGVRQMAMALLAGLIAGVIFLLFFLAGGMGAGDVKLIAAVGCLAGIAHLEEILLATVVIGGVMAVGLATIRGQLRETFSNVFTLVHHHRSNGLKQHPELNVRNRASLRLPYALPIAGGVLATLLLVGLTGMAS